MNKKLKSIIAVVAVLFLVVVGFNMRGKADQSFSQIKEKGKFVVGLDDSFPPMGFRDKEGDIVGFDIDMAREAAKRMGLKVEFKPVEWDGVIMSLKSGHIDVIWNGLTITEEREKKIGFTDPYLKNRQIIVVRKDSNIEEKSDLSGKKVGVQLGSSSVNAIKSEPEVLDTLQTMRKFSNNTEALMDLKIGRIDAVVVDEIVGRYYIRKKPGVYRVLEDNFGKEAYGVGVRKEDVSFGNKLNQVLTEMKKDGTAAKFAEKWFGDDDILQ